MDRFQGGSHTIEKVTALSAYLTAYTTALKNQNFALTYIDAFAGSGSYSVGRNDETALQANMLTDDGVVSLPGSARIALETVPEFACLVFVEKNASSARALQAMVDADYPAMRHKVKVHAAEANEAVKQLCNMKWNAPCGSARNGMRAVMFLDPFALSVDWETLVKIGETGAIDIWYLLPVGAMNRLMPGDFDKVGPSSEDHLNRTLGGDWWQEELYRQPEQTTDLFGVPVPTSKAKKTGSRLKIEAAFIERLRAHFGYVHPNALRLDKGGQHYFSLVFAIASRNPKAHALGRSFAVSIIDKPQRLTPQRGTTDGPRKRPGIV